MTTILGISAFYHDSAASLIEEGKIIAAAQEERFTRKKHDASYPKNAIKFVLNYANLNLSEVDNIVFFETDKFSLTIVLFKTVKESNIVSSLTITLLLTDTIPSINTFELNEIPINDGQNHPLDQKK